MTWIMVEIGKGGLLIVVFFVLSLIGAIVLFKLLRSTAIIKKFGYQAGGAIAGFLLIYSMLFYSYERISKDSNIGELHPWIIEGKVEKADKRTYEGIIVKQVPSTPSDITDESGYFTLREVMISDEEWPELFLESKNYFSKKIDLNKHTAVKDIKKKKIKLKSIEKLEKLPE